MPNFDLLATSISWDNGPGGRNNRLFQSLYDPVAKSMVGFISTTFINFMSLLGLIFLLIKTYIDQSNKRLKKYNKKKIVSDELANIIGTAMIMLLITYLLPNPVILQLQSTSQVFLTNTFGLTRDSLLLYFILVCIGLLFSTVCIFTEMYLIKMKIFVPFLKGFFTFISFI